ncbi:hypothetical protein OESDEN_21407 [Oesophagostomum dentatum]|uniref:Uncharacterized protein n=1 Tax=Oesophagostomum dentatum TaxID=61180 RepID=A0A0B1S203_OESDE|nr:hypothetical protein OESDEN_21407 [Oesophagostomum dentatum]
MHIDLEHASPKFVDLPCADIFKWLCEGTALVENQSTQVVPLAPINFLHELDHVTQEIVTVIMEAQRNTPIGHYIVITCHQPSDGEKISHIARTNTFTTTVHHHVEDESD